METFSEKHTDIIVSYLEYLKEVSRKIISGAGFEKAYLDKNRTNPSYRSEMIPSFPFAREVKYGMSFYNYFDTCIRYLERNSDRKLFMGSGEVLGKRDKDETFIQGPLLYMECEVYRNDKDNKDNMIIIDPQIYTITINYDLISYILGSDKIVEDEEIFDEKYIKYESIIEKIEEDLKDLANMSEEEFDYSFLTKILTKISEEIFQKLRKNIEEFSKIEMINKNDCDFITNRANGGSGLVYYSHNHYFINKIPDQLSTYEALKKLIDEVKNEGFKNPVLDKLLRNALVSDDISINTNDDYKEEVKKVIDLYLPISLSKTQENAIEKAWTSEISYIQGPPGTGKSHTISAIILSAVFLNKKVLVVSQKRPALEVVNNKVQPYLAKDYKIKSICYFDRGERQGVREYVKTLLEISYDKRGLLSQINSMEEQIKNTEKDLREKITELREENEKLNKYLDTSRQFFEKNEELQSDIKFFEKSYGVSIPENLEFKPIEAYERYEEVLNILKKIDKSPYKTLAGELYKTKFKTHLKEKYAGTPEISEWFDRLFNNHYISEVGGDFVKLNRVFTRTQKLLANLHKNPTLIRDRIENLKKNIKELQEKLICLRYQVRILKYLNDDKHVRMLEKFSSMLFNVKPHLVKSKMQDIDFDKITDVIPFWSAEIRYIGNLFPLKPDLFDIVIVDEASQVNLAEIFPVFYRGKKILVVGDHKQLSLNATGVNFHISKKFDNLTWNKYRCGGLSYEIAKDRYLTVTDSSILDFIRSEHNAKNLPQIMLDEHFRSLPILAKYTNDTFYEGRLKIMTETPDRIIIKPFKAIKITGKRDSDKKTIEKEALKIIDIINNLIKNPGSILPQELVEIIDKRGRDFTIGVISMIRNQCELIKDFISEQCKDEDIKKYDLKIGTPEEFQGDERDIMIFSLCLDSFCRGYTHYQNPNRLNVATSRARLFTIFVFAAIPQSFDRIFNYLKFFEGYVSPEYIVNDTIDTSFPETEYNPIQWKFDPAKFESDFERYVYSVLEKYREERNKKANIKIYNQVTTCGQKRVDFVLYNEKTKSSVAIEVDGPAHFLEDGLKPLYTEKHIERIGTLKRAGWNIINLPYYRWYKNGRFINENDYNFKKEIENLYNKLDTFLDCK